MDLAASADARHEPGKPDLMRIISYRNSSQRVRTKARHFPGFIHMSRLGNGISLRLFDDKITAFYSDQLAPMTISPVRPRMWWYRIAVPTLIIQCRVNDPFICMFPRSPSQRIAHNPNITMLRYRGRRIAVCAFFWRDIRVTRKTTAVGRKGK